MGKTTISLNQLKNDLNERCVHVEDRHVGSKGNQQVSNYISKRLASSGFNVSKPEFNCIDWEYGRCLVEIDGKYLNAFISPYSNPCDLKKVFETAKTKSDLLNKDFKGKIAVLYGDLCKEQIMPKNFEFYNPKEHQEIIGLLEKIEPVAIVAITGKHPELAGALDPFPLFEDGDFDIPSVYLTKAEGEKILNEKGKKMSVSIESSRIPSFGYNVIGTKKGSVSERIVICAHLDSKKGSPGALDNGTGLGVLLLLADKLTNYQGKYTIEIAALNGEDYYTNPGQMLYLEQNQDAFQNILLAVNCDGAAYYKGKTSYCPFELNEEMRKAVEKHFTDRNGFIEAKKWYQGDHMLFVMNEIPSLAITSEYFNEVSSEIAHTPQDTIDKVNFIEINHIVDALINLIKSHSSSLKQM